MTNRVAHDLILRPIITERATDLQALEAPQYVFQVDVSANKVEIARAIAEVFGVKVRSVNTLTRLGKMRRTRGRAGRRADTRRAFVTLEPGQKIEFF